MKKLVISSLVMGIVVSTSLSANISSQNKIKEQANVIGKTIGDVKNGKVEFKRCSACHGVNAEKKALGKSKVIVDMSKEDLVKALKGYKEGTYGGSMKSLMKAQVMKLDDKKINDIAEYVSNIK
jgi:cytochrome c553